MANYSMPCRDLNALHTTAKRACELFLSECKKEGLNVGVCETLRTAEYQNTLYQKGRTTGGSIVTNCDGFKIKSEHQSSMAFDFFQNIKGKEWDKSFYNKACPIAKRMGLDSGHYWNNFIDSPHITVPKDWKEPVIKEEYEVVKTKIELNGKIKDVDSIQLNGNNYIKLQDLRDGQIIIDYNNDKKMPIVRVSK